MSGEPCLSASVMMHLAMRKTLPDCQGQWRHQCLLSKHPESAPSTRGCEGPREADVGVGMLAGGAEEAWGSCCWRCALASSVCFSCPWLGGFF